ncbi:CsgG/HfaB family protein, partial [Desulfobacterales bacterium HSG17]|nr:CsgG/HfaB family protein [Desulfobacterales bacterium HSG17]
MKKLNLVFSVILLTTSLYFTGCAGTANIGQNSKLSFRGTLPKTLAIFPFENNSFLEANLYEPLGKGLSTMLITDLNSISRKLTIVERENIRALIEEGEFTRTDFVDQSTAIKIGKMLGAESVGFGSFIVMSKQVRIDMRIIQVETGELVMADYIKGDKDNILGLVQGLGKKIADVFSMAYFAKSPGTGKTNINAALYFSRGLDALDNGKIKDAQKLFEQCIRTDSSFRVQIRKELQKHEQNARLNKTGNENPKDTTPPEIVLLSPEDFQNNPAVRGIRLKAKLKQTMIKGMLIDDSPLLYLKINNENVYVDE